jgi:uncharacterized phage-associated protein
VLIHQAVAPSYVSERLLRLAHTSSRLLTPMQILKLVYISHGWMLGLVDQPLILEAVEAWRYGPVVRSVYRKYRKYRGNPISEPGALHDGQLHGVQRDVIDQVYQGYGRYTGIGLSSLTHQRGTPWEVAWNAGMRIIPNELIQDYYRRRAAELKASHAGE